MSTKYMQQSRADDLSATWGFRKGSPQDKIIQTAVRMAREDYAPDMTRYDCVYLIGEMVKRLTAHNLPEVGQVDE